MAPLSRSALVLGVFQLAQHVSVAAAAEVDVKWHAPLQRDVNNLTQVVNGEGVYGYIYDSSTTPDKEYGIYNWCNMPHVRKREYVKADKGFELQYVELIQRHHKRTPYSSNAFPVEPYQWNCDDSLLHFYGEPLASHSAAQAFRKGYISPINPYVPSGWIGSCQFPQITAEGLDDSWQHGEDLYGVYGELLGFLPKKGASVEGKVKYRVTNNLITHQVAGMLINGMWGTTDDFPLLVQAENVDSLEPQYSCPSGSSGFNRIKSSANPAWQQHLDLAKPLFSTLDGISGVPPNDGGFHASFDHYYDNLSARQCHAGKPAPCKLEGGKNTSTCVTQDMSDAVYRMGHWEYSQIYRDSPDSLAASVASYGVWVAELAAHLREVVEGKRTTLYFHNVAHDGSMSRLMSILQLDEMVWPGMGTEIVFELYKKKAGGEDPKPTATVVAPGCSHNNCLRQMIRSSSAASSFCPSFTASSATAVPAWPSQCSNANQVSSACSCIVPASATTSGAAPTATATPSESGFYVRVLFGGQVFKSSSPTLGLMDMISVETLLAYFDGLVGKNASAVKGKCQ